MPAPEPPSGKIRHFTGVASPASEALNAVRAAADSQDEMTVSASATPSEIAPDETDALIDKALRLIVDTGKSFEAARKDLDIKPQAWAVLINSFRFASRHERAVARRSNDIFSRAMDDAIGRLPGLSGDEYVEVLKVIVSKAGRLDRFAVQVSRSSARGRAAAEPEPGPNMALELARKNLTTHRE